MEISEVQPILQKKPFDRSSQDVAALAAFLCSQMGFFGGMQHEVAQLLCTLIGHAHVQEGAQVFKQGQVGDCMYVVLRGYCSVLKHPQLTSNSSNGNQQQDNSDTGIVPDSSSVLGGRSAHVSRRTTMERQVQQFALATAAVGGTLSRRGTVEDLLQQQQQQQLLPAGSSLAPAVAAAAAAVGVLPDGVLAGQGGATCTAYRLSAGSRRCTVEGAVPLPLSRRATADQIAQQQLAESVHIGWVGEGESFGEAAVFSANKPRPVSVVAGDSGVTLAVLDRAGYNKLQQQAKAHHAVAAAALQAVLAAAARPLLQVPPNKRTAEQAEALADMLAGLEAFGSLPQPVRVKLAKACQAVHLPAGSVVFEEDQKGDAMYIVMSGSCQVRARPLKADSAAAEGEAAAAAEAASTASTKRGATTASGAALAAAAAAAAGQRGMVLQSSTSFGVRRTTWEGVAFTAQEQAKLEAVKAALDARQQQEGQGEAMEQYGSKHHHVERDGVYWTAKYMSDAVASATAADPHWGLQGGLTPLESVFVAKWRQQMHKQHAELQAQQQQADDADKAYAAMEEMLGKAAAKAWKAARDSALNPNADAALSRTATSAVVADAMGGCGSIPQPCSVTSSRANSSKQLLAVEGCTSLHRSASTASHNSTVEEQNAAAGAGAAEVPDDSGVVASSSGAPTPRTAAATAVAAAAGLLAAAAAAANPAEALKLQLAAVGVKDPANVSRHLLEEVAVRADLDWLLATVAAQLEAKGLPRRLSKKSSMKITRELNKRMLAGASWKGYGSKHTGSNSSDGQHHQQAGSGEGRIAFAEGAQDADSACNAGNQSSRCLGASVADDASELGTEVTGISSCDWHSSLDGSETASLCMSMDADEDGQISSSITGSGNRGFSKAASSSSGEVPAALEASAAVRGTTSLSVNASASCGDSGLPPLGPGAVPKLAAVLGGCGLGAQLGGSKLSSAQLSAEQCERLYGPVVRVILPGESFGELALLKKAATRTATVVVTPDAVVPAVGESAGGDAGVAWNGWTEPDAAAAAAEAVATSAAVHQQERSCAKTATTAGLAAPAGVLLIRISRSCYDATVRSLQVAALEELLLFLQGVAPFKALSRELLTSLAVYVRPVKVGAGEVLAVAGSATSALMIIQEGEVRLLDCLAGPLTGQLGMHAASQLPRSRRATADEALLQANGSTGSTAADQQYSASGSRALIKQLSIQQRQGSLLPGQLPIGSGIGSTSSSTSGSGSGGTTGLTALGVGRVHHGAAPLAVLGPGSLLGENVLGYNAEQDPLQAIAAAKGHKARQEATATANSLVHQADAVAAAPCRILVISAEGLRRFGRRVRGPLAQLAECRRAFLQQRRAAVQDTKFSRAAMMSDMRHQRSRGSQAAAASCATAAAAYYTAGGSSGGSGSGNGSAARPPTGCVHRSGSLGRYGQPLPSVHSMALGGGSSSSCDGHSPTGRSRLSGNGFLPGSAGHTAAAVGALDNTTTSSSVSSLSGSIPSGAMLLRRTGSSNSGNGGGDSNSSSRPSVSQWQQQQWQQQAFGELLKPQPAVQQMTVTEVARLRQVVPGSGAPCVSELAAASRVFPAGALTATAAISNVHDIVHDAALAGIAAPGSTWRAAAGSPTLNSTAVAAGMGGIPSNPPAGQVFASRSVKAGSAKGLRLLVGGSYQQDSVWPAPDPVGSPAWIVGPGGKVTAAEKTPGQSQGAAAVAAAAEHAL